MKLKAAQLAAAYSRRAFWTTSAVLATACLGWSAAFGNPQTPAAPSPPSVTTDTAPNAQSGAQAQKSTSQRKKRIWIMPARASRKRSTDAVAGSAVSAAGAPPPAVPGGPAPTAPADASAAPGAAPSFSPALNSTPFSFSFSSDITNVLKFFANMSGMPIAADSTLTGPVTIIAPKAVTLDEAFRILQQVLGSRGFTALQQDGVISILPFDKAVQSTPYLNKDPDNTGKIDSRNQVMTQLIPLQNADAELMAKELAPMITKGAQLIASPTTNSLIRTDRANNVTRFLDLIASLDQVSNTSDMKIYQLKRADASSIADTINNIYKQITPRGVAGAPAAPGQPAPQAQTGRPAVVAVAELRSNSVLVVASPENQMKVAEMIGRLDGDESVALTTEFRKIKFAVAVDVANAVNSVLSDERGNVASSSTSGQAGFGQRQRGGNTGYGSQQSQPQVTVISTDPFANVAADPRTNSVLITASPDRAVRIKELIDKLDVDMPVEPTTFVVPLKNVQAADMAYVLSLAFGTNSAANGSYSQSSYSRGGTSGSGTSHTPISRTASATISPMGIERSAPPSPPDSPDPAAQGDATSTAADGSTDPAAATDTTAGSGVARRPLQFSYTSVSRSGGQGNIQSYSTTYGRGSNGDYGNLLALQSNVFVTPSPNGDSILVTTAPANYKAVVDIVNQLDVVPRQVMIEAIVAEVTLTQDEQLGFTFNGKFASLFSGANTGQVAINNVSSTANQSFTPTANGSQFSISAANYDVLLQALSTDNKVKVLATPRIFTSNSQEARVQISTMIPYASGSTAASLGTAVSYTTSYLNVGYTLDVTPRITRNGLVSLIVQQEASNLLQFLTLGTGTNATQTPEYNDRWTDTYVTAQDGETIVLSGIIQDQTGLNITRTPILSDIPLIGQFFRQHEKTHNKVELLVFLTPHVVNSAEEARALAQKTSANLLKQFPDLKNQQPSLDPKKPGAQTLLKVQDDLHPGTKIESLSKQHAATAAPAPATPDQSK